MKGDLTIKNLELSLVWDCHLVNNIRNFSSGMGIRWQIINGKTNSERTADLETRQRIALTRFEEG